MSTSVTGTTSSYWSTPTTVDSGTSASGTDNLGTADSFLKILASELQYQDPTEPVSNTEYVAQMAQFNSLQQLSTMSNSMSEYQAYSLIGKTVSYSATDSAGNSVSGSGKVDSVLTQNNTVYLIVNSSRIKLSSVTQVTNTVVTGTNTSETTSTAGTSTATGTTTG